MDEVWTVFTYRKEVKVVKARRISRLGNGHTHTIRLPLSGEFRKKGETVS